MGVQVTTRLAQRKETMDLRLCLIYGLVWNPDRFAERSGSDGTSDRTWLASMATLSCSVTVRTVMSRLVKDNAKSREGKVSRLNLLGGRYPYGR